MSPEDRVVLIDALIDAWLADARAGRQPRTRYGDLRVGRDVDLDGDIEIEPREIEARLGARIVTASGVEAQILAVWLRQYSEAMS